MRLKLIDGPLSYSGIVRATAKRPVVEVEDEAIATMAMASGYFILLDSNVVPHEQETTEDVEEAGESLQYGGKLLNEMNKSELETFAAYRNVDIKECKTKTQIIAALREALPTEDLEGLIFYGSPTMVDLQK